VVGSIILGQEVKNWSWSCCSRIRKRVRTKLLRDRWFIIYILLVKSSIYRYSRLLYSEAKLRPVCWAAWRSASLYVYYECGCAKRGPLLRANADIRNLKFLSRNRM
jgi:hypothetical protein